jgi:hypothetical protein
MGIQYRCNSKDDRRVPSTYLGGRSHCYVHLARWAEPILVSLQNLERSTNQLHQLNQPVWLQWARDAVVMLLWGLGGTT